MIESLATCKLLRASYTLVVMTRTTAAREFNFVRSAHWYYVCPPVRSTPPEILGQKSTAAEFRAWGSVPQASMPAVAFLVDVAASAARRRHAEQLRQCSQMLRHHGIAMAQSEKHQVQPVQQQRLGYHRMRLA